MDAPVVVVGGSAGGLEAMRCIVESLPSAFPAPICLVLHSSPDSPGLVPEILGRAGSLPAEHAGDESVLRPGFIYVAPPDRHFILTERGRMRLSLGPKENRFRPAIDPLFRSAANIYGARTVGLILSGGLDDGVAGLAAIKKRGGFALVQDPADAAVLSMPQAALRNVAVDRAVRLMDIAETLTDIVRTMNVGDVAMPDKDSALETEIALGRDPERAVRQLGTPSLLACPDCGGVLVQLKNKPLRFRCHTGHAYSAQTLSEALKQGADQALWSAMRALQERQIMLEEYGGDVQMRALVEQAIDDLRRLLDRLGAEQDATD